MKYDINAFIDKLRVRTPMYTGDYSLGSLNTYLAGAIHVLDDLDVCPKDNPIVESEYFYDFILNKYGYSARVIGWANVITAVALGHKPDEIRDWDKFEKNLTDEDHLKAHELFYKIFDDCRNERDKVNREYGH